MPVGRIVSAHDVARELKRRKPDAGKTQIMKWLYVAQGLHLAWFAAPMFREDVEAWENGPVIADYWHDLKEGRPLPPAMPLDDSMNLTLDAVIAFWGEMSGAELSRMTHSDGGPWCQVTEALDEFSPRNPQISHDAMRAWFGGHPVTCFRAETEPLGSAWTLVPADNAPGLAASLGRVLAGEVIREPRPT